MQIDWNIPGAADRRRFLTTAASLSGLALASCAAGSSRSRETQEHAEGSDEGAEVTPGEDLMQEHGVVERILLLYDESARRIERGEPADAGVVGHAAEIVRTFVEDYHERTEEEFVFPRLEKAGREVELVAILKRQHERGREVTKEILRLAPSKPGPELASLLRGFARMYRPHAAREDTVLFPAFRELVSGAEYRELGEQFEEREHRQLGEHGFEGAVADVARLEATLRIGDLATFTA
jgi:hemerythrin-like domain-containing protein